MILYVAYAFVFIAILFYLFSKWRFSFWTRAGVEYYESKFFQYAGTKMFNSYHEFKKKGAKHVGAFVYFKPIYIPIDIEIIKNIMQNDFQHFINRGLIRDPPILFRHLLHMEGEEWRFWRTKMTPAFTSEKMKMMFQIMVDKSIILADIFKEHAKLNDQINLKDIFSRYTIDVIGSNAFGIECDSLKKQYSEFQSFGIRLIEQVKFVSTLMPIPKPLLKLSGISMFPKDMENFFLGIIQNTIKYREANNIFRKDFMHLLLQLKNIGHLSDEEKVLNEKNEAADHMTLNQVAAQCLVFFGAGTETSSSTMTYAMLELCQHQDIQDKLRKNIREVLQENGGALTYDAIMKMEYLDQVVSETLRKHPPAQFFPRQCTKDYPVPGTTVVLKKGQEVLLPFRAVHYDEEYWPDPEKFDPERFNAENKVNIHQFAYLPFGKGPRMCIGARFGLMQVKTGIALIIKDCRITMGDKTPEPVKFDFSYFLTVLKQPLWMKVEKVD